VFSGTICVYWDFSSTLGQSPSHSDHPETVDLDLQRHWSSLIITIFCGNNLHFPGTILFTSFKWSCLAHLHEEAVKDRQPELTSAIHAGLLLSPADIPVDSAISQARQKLFRSSSFIILFTCLTMICIQRTRTISGVQLAISAWLFITIACAPSSEANLGHILPVDNGPYAWVLDFRPDGVVLSQTRMLEVQLLLGLQPSVDCMQMSFGYTGSWIDLLVCLDMLYL
jgi:hypothetical protein